MSEMEYHEIGEKFEYDGVLLEVMERTHVEDCKKCYLKKECNNINRGYFNHTQCYSLFRDSDDDVYYRLIEQCKTKDMEQKTEINIEEVNKEMTEYIKSEAEKYNTPPNGIKTIPKGQFIYKEILDKLFETYKAKDRDYGSAFSEMFDELGIDYAYGKLREKMNRIKVLRKQPNMVKNEGLEDALLDTAGYAILTLVELKKRGNG